MSKRNQRMYKMFEAERAAQSDNAGPEVSSKLGIIAAIVLFIVNSLLLSGCNKPPPASESCTVVAIEPGIEAYAGAEIECPDGTHQTIVDGRQGFQGPPGINGQPCTITSTASGADIQCPGGATSSIYNGTNGTNATPITVIQFCSASYVPTYPSVFPEVGFVINGVLYAVYSANGGFLSPILPGTYSSNGIGASCTFTVNADLSITQN